MRNYVELVKRLREHNGWALNETLDQAADAIEELTTECRRLREATNTSKWISVEDENGQV